MPASLDFFEQLNLMSETATASGVPKVAIVDAGLAHDIAVRATLATKNASDAIGAWVAAERLTADAAVLNDTFFQQRGEGGWKVANIAVGTDGEVALRFTKSDSEHYDYLTAARLAADGSLVGRLGERMIPASLAPERNAHGTEIRFDGGFAPVILLGSKGQWGMFETVGRERQDTHVDLLSATLVVPPEVLFVEPGTAIADVVRSQLVALHLKSLEGKVQAILADTPTGDSVFAVGRFLRKLHRGFLSAVSVPTPEDFLPEERTILAPVFEILNWPISTEEWEGTVNIDTASGWSAEVNLEAVHRPTGTTVEAEQALMRNSLDADPAALAWFDRTKRLQLAIAELKKALEEELAPAPESSTAPATQPRRKTNASKSSPVILASTLASIHEFAAVVKAHATSEGQLAAITEAQEVSASSTEAQGSGALEKLSQQFASLAETLAPQAAALLGERVWSTDHRERAAGLLKLAEPFHSLHFSEELRALNYFVGEFSRQYVVREIAPGWWVIVSEDGRRGAVSSTGYYSTSGLGDEPLRSVETADPRTVISCLLEDTPSATRFSRVAKSEKYAAPLIAWLKTQPFAPDDNAVRRLIKLGGELEQRLNVRKNINRALGCVIHPDASRTEAARVYQALQCDKIANGSELLVACIARDLLSEKFGDFTPTKENSSSLFADDESRKKDEVVDDDESDGDENEEGGGDE